VARAVVNRPQLLLADEPTSNLDDQRCWQALDLLETQARACGATLVIATHDQRIKSRIAHHYALGG
jgi:putative ABC transport system ATP-binding protein